MTCWERVQFDIKSRQQAAGGSMSSLGQVISAPCRWPVVESPCGLKMAIDPNAQRHLTVTLDRTLPTTASMGIA